MDTEVQEDAWTCPACDGYGSNWHYEDGWVRCDFCSEGVTDTSKALWLRAQKEHWGEMAVALGVADPSPQPSLHIDLLKNFVHKSCWGPRPTPLDGMQAEAAIDALARLAYGENP